MTLEEFTAHLNGSIFWKEFTFSQTKFSPRPKQEVELADGIVRIASLTYILQLKERTGETDDPEIEENWFHRKVIKKATKQMRDSARYLSEHETIRLVNERGRTVELQSTDLVDTKKIIIFKGGTLLPAACRSINFHVSETVGFVHVIEISDYANILRCLIIPEDIRRYLDYRQSALLRLRETGTTVDEPDIMVGFLTELDLPAPQSKERLRLFVQDVGDFDLSHIMQNLLNHVQKSGQDSSYYEILSQFARVPRTVWREFKRRLLLSLEASKAAEFCQPFRFTFPATDCTFMVASLDPDMPVAGAEGERIRTTGLEMFTRGAKYDARSAVGVGLMVSTHGNDVYLDWCLVDQPWEHDAWLENMLATSNPFRPVTEKRLDSFLFRDPETAA